MKKILYLTLPLLLFMLFGGACSKGKSYSVLLREEEKATNWYLSGQRVERSVPSDSILECGENAPFYRLDKDGYIYMQIVNLGDTSDMISYGEQVYFRYLRWNIEDMYDGLDPTPQGNANSLTNSTSFVYGNTQLAASSGFGSGIQMPLQFVGNNSEVNLVLRSYYGFQVDQADCVPYLINLKYFKAEY